MALGSTQSLTEMSTRNLPGDKALPARKAGNLTSICEPMRIEGCRIVIAADPHSRILDFIDWSRYYFFQVASQFYSRG
jgi:hypothetical protein